MTTTTKTQTVTRSELRKSGTHKHGGTIYSTLITRSTLVYPDDMLLELLAVGVVAKMNKLVTADNPDHQYLANDWTLPAFTPEGERVNPVTYFVKRADAMAHLNAIADRELEARNN